MPFMAEVGTIDMHAGYYITGYRAHVYDRTFLILSR